MAKKNRKPTPAEILRLGPEVAQVKASMPRKRWRRFVKSAHKQGFTVAGQLSGAPDALKERTGKGIRQQATRATRAAYKPVMAELNRREKATKNLESARAAADANYRTWMMGEVGKLNAQAGAADASLQAQQTKIATDLTAAQQAAKADSLARATAVGPGSTDPNKAGQLDQSAVDAHSQQQVADARTHTAEISKIGADSAQLTRGAVLATAAVREATRTAELWKTQAEIAASRKDAKLERASATKDMIQGLRDKEVSKAQTREELALAGAELGVKRAGIAADAKAAKRDYKLDRDKFNLDKWKANHADKVARAKIDLDYDKIRSTEGQKAADRALDKQLTTMLELGRNTRSAADRAADRQADRDEKKSVDKDERKIYADLETARTLILRKLRNGKSESQARKELIGMGISNVMFDVANDLRNNNGKLSTSGFAKAKRLGISHVGYFYDLAPSRPHDSQQR